MEALKAEEFMVTCHCERNGERAGERLWRAVAVINDFMPELSINVKESIIYKVSKLVQNLYWIMHFY
jgi:D-citramalate synthase